MPKFLGIEMAQSWNDFPIWEEFFDKYPIRTFIELGTGHGGMTLFFGLQCFQRGIQFHTFDHQRWFDFSNGMSLLINLNASYHWFDIFSQDGGNEIAGLINSSPKPLAIFFDNGNKPREWKNYAPLTSPGDFCIVHDWGMEFKQEHIGDLPVERILVEMSDERPHAWMSMWFKRI
jgi:hypothetical protein